MPQYWYMYNHCFWTYLFQQMDILGVPGTKHRNQCDPMRHRWCAMIRFVPLHRHCFRPQPQPTTKTEAMVALSAQAICLLFGTWRQYCHCHSDEVSFFSFWIQRKLPSSSGLAHQPFVLLEPQTNQPPRQWYRCHHFFPGLLKKKKERRKNIIDKNKILYLKTFGHLSPLEFHIIGKNSSQVNYKHL